MAMKLRVSKYFPPPTAIAKCETALRKALFTGQKKELAKGYVGAYFDEAPAEHCHSMFHTMLSTSHDDYFTYSEPVVGMGKKRGIENKEVVAHVGAAICEAGLDVRRVLFMCSDDTKYMVTANEKLMDLCKHAVRLPCNAHKAFNLFETFEGHDLNREMMRFMQLVSTFFKYTGGRMKTWKTTQEEDAHFPPRLIRREMPKKKRTRDEEAAADEASEAEDKEDNEDFEEVEE